MCMPLKRETGGDNDELDVLWRLRSTFDEVLVCETSFVVRFPFLEKVVSVDVGSQILDACSTLNFVTVVTDGSIFIAHKDELDVPKCCVCKTGAAPSLEFESAEWVLVTSESRPTAVSDRWWTKKKPPSHVILTSTVSTVYLVYTLYGVSTVVRLFNETAYLESGIIKSSVVQVPEDMKIVTAVSGNDHSLFLTDKGAVYALGTGSRGELGNGLIPRVCELTWVEALEGLKVVDIAAAGWHSGVLTNDGDVYLWGWNHRGQLGDEKEQVEYYPSPLEIDIRIVRIEMREHLTALWTAEDGEEPSMVFGSSDIGMPVIRLRYYHEIPDSNVAEDRNVEMLFVKKNKEDDFDFERRGGVNAQLDHSELHGSFEYPSIRERD
ncbi:hypothetical protein V3C99_006524 [Haemonchus contortus]